MNTNHPHRHRPRLAAVQMLLSLLALMPTANQQAAQLEWQCSGPRIITVKDEPTRMVVPAGGGFTITLTFDATVPAAHRPVIQFAVNEWDAVLQSSGVNPANYPITVRYGAPNPGALATTYTTYAVPSGVLRRADMVIDPNQTWYVDPNPADDVEFGNNPPPGFDLLSVVRHELGHALGWLDNGNGRIALLVASGVFDGSRLNIAMVGSHADGNAHPGELMQPTIGQRVRRGIALYPTVALVSRAFEYQMPMHFVDPNFGGTATGSAWAPWRSFQDAMNSAPGGVPLLLAPTTLTVSAGAAFSTPHTIQSARGGATIR